MMTTRVLLGTMLMACGLSAAEPCTVEVSVSNTAATQGAALFQAKITASEVFAAAGVKLRWLNASANRRAGCAKPIEIRFETGTSAEERPGALAYARPYLAEGASIHVYVDRVTAMAGSNRLGLLLGHVLAHEIAHVVEGVSRHSEAGVMKAHWDRNDLREMERKPLRFAEMDVVLLQAAQPAPVTAFAANR
jgi:hypothetical protein